MQLQPIVGAKCAACTKPILVDLDGKNCKRCGLAIHRRCGKDHRASCTGKAQVTEVAHDYDEVAPVAWTTRLVALLAAGAFVFAVGLGMLLAGPSDPTPTISSGDARPAAAGSGKRTAIGWGALALGALIAGGGWAVERSRQGRKS